MEKEFGLTNEELEQAKVDLGFEDDLEDFELEENKITYEIWVLGYDSDMNATDFETLIDDGYSELEEAKKCFDYFTNLGAVTEFLEKKNITVPAGTKYLHLFLEECMEVDDGSGGRTTECQDVLDEVEIL